MRKLIIAIDGFSSTGKSTFAKLIASRLEIPYMDSGAMYRAITLYSMENGLIDASHDISLDALRADLDGGKVTLEFKVNPETAHADMHLNGRNVERQIRQMEVSSNVSYISVIPFVRDFVDENLHALGSAGCVMDGRDIGTAVFPDADLKIYMTADAEIRAQRRLDELKMKGEKADFEEVLRNVKERDYIDSHRDYHPLCKPEDALVLDNSHMTMEEQMVWLSGVLRERFNIEL